MKNGDFAPTPAQTKSLNCIHRQKFSTILHYARKTDTIIGKEEMKKHLAILLFGCTACGSVSGATIDWWNHDTICQINNSRCYGNTTDGMDLSLETGWDISGSCRGKKYICASALNPQGFDNIAMEKYDIVRKLGINTDFDTDIYVSAGNCYGARKTQQNGTMVSLDGEYVRVWCTGILSGDTETVANGEISKIENPTCLQLADMSYTATLNGKCYGKKYDPIKYAIDCTDDKPMLIILNGAEYSRIGNNPMTKSLAKSRFDTMQVSAKQQRAIHFPNK